MPTSSLAATVQGIGWSMDSLWVLLTCSQKTASSHFISVDLNTRAMQDASSGTKSMLMTLGLALILGTVS